MSSGHLVIRSSGYLVTCSSVHLVIRSFPILWKTVLFLWNTLIISTHSESCFGDLIEQSGYLVIGMNTGQRTGGKDNQHSVAQARSSHMIWAMTKFFQPQICFPLSHNMDWKHILSDKNWFPQNRLVSSPPISWIVSHATMQRSNIACHQLIIPVGSQVTRQTLQDLKGLPGTGKYKSILVVKDS